MRIKRQLFIAHLPAIAPVFCNELGDLPRLDFGLEPRGVIALAVEHRVQLATPVRDLAGDVFKAAVKDCGIL